MLAQKEIKAKPKYTIKQIFADHWQPFLIAHSNLTIRKAVYKNVNKILINLKMPNISPGIYYLLL